jgi:peptidoglycan/xylan/chitin deacetylase (PgdA/CDA1 family)
MDFIARHHYRVIPLEKLIMALSQGKAIPRETLAITFDDGTADIYQNAFPILKQYGFPATIFMISDYIGKYVGKEYYLSSEQLKEMQGYGIDIGSHTKTHSYLPDIVDEQRLWNEIFESKKELENKMGREISLFSYPVGGYNTKVIDFIKRAGYIGACTTNRGRYHLNPDIYALRRIRMNDHSDNLLVMWIKLSGIYNLFRRR